MSKWIVASCICCMLSLSPQSAAFAMTGLGAVPQQEAKSPIVEVRTFCYNRYTGRFKHWGACHASAPPRVYCRSRFGEFLHWGAC